MARGGPDSGSRLSREEHLSQVKQERAQKEQRKHEDSEKKSQAKVAAQYEKEWKKAEGREQSKAQSEARKEKWDSFWKNAKSGAESTWKNVKGLGPKAVDFMKDKAGKGQDMLDSLVAEHRYKKQEKETAKEVRGRAMASARQIESALKEHKGGVKEHDAVMRKREWDQKVSATKEKWKNNVTAAQEWGKARVDDAINKGKDMKHKHWDVPVNDFKVKRVNSKLEKQQEVIRTEIGMNAQEIALLMDRVRELQAQNKGLNAEYKFLAHSGVDRGKADAVLGTADLSKKTAWMTQGKADLETLFSMRSVS